MHNMPANSSKTEHELLARARKSRSVSLPLKTAPPENGGAAFHFNRRCRHNTLDFATQNRVPKVAAAPLWNPPQSIQKAMHRVENCAFSFCLLRAKSHAIRLRQKCH